MLVLVSVFCFVFRPTVESTGNTTLFVLDTCSTIIGSKKTGAMCTTQSEYIHRLFDQSAGASPRPRDLTFMRFPRFLHVSRSDWLISVTCTCARCDYFEFFSYYDSDLKTLCENRIFFICFRLNQKKWENY